MKLLTMLLCLAGFLMVAVATPPFAEGLTFRDNNNDLPYPLVPAQWTVNLKGKEYKLNGTARSVHVQLDALHPDWRSLIAVDNSSIAADNAPLKPRNKDHIICCKDNNWHWPSGSVTNFWQDEEDLRHLGMTPCGVQARSCVQIACSHNDGVVLCNDNWYYIQPAAQYLGTYSIDIRGACQIYWTACGQEFDSDNYNVIIKGQTYPGC